MPHGEAYCVLIIVVVASRNELDNVISLISSFEFVPKCVSRSCSVIKCCGRGTVEGFYALTWITNVDMTVVAVVLGKGFLEDRTKDGFVW